MPPRWFISACFLLSGATEQRTTVPVLIKLLNKKISVRCVVGHEGLLGALFSRSGEE